MDQKTLYTRALSADFLYWLNENKLLKTFKSNPLLNIGMRGNKIIIYYRGAKILTITDRISCSRTGNKANNSLCKQPVGKRK